MAIPGDLESASVLNPRSVLADGLVFLKAHGTENDFVVLPDDSATIDLTPELVRGLCDRRAGLGADGALRIATAGALVESGVLATLPDGVVAEHWFMDYRNADGSVAEMCGNGVRAFAHVLVATGRATRGVVPVGTRAGLRPAEVLEADAERAMVRVDMGEPDLLGVSTAVFDGHSVAGVGVDVGNPHLACVVPGLDLDGLAAFPVEAAPSLDPAFFPAGANVEISTSLEDGACRMRVHERGAGETRSCGTGIVATALAVLADAGRTDGEVDVHVPGGTVHVRLFGGRALMTGPSEIVAEGIVRPITR